MSKKKDIMRRREGGKKMKIKTRYSFEELLANTDFEALNNDEYIKAWLEIKPVGRELL